MFLRYLNVVVQFCFLASTRNFIRRLQSTFVLMCIPHEDLILESGPFQKVEKLLYHETLSCVFYQRSFCRIWSPIHEFTEGVSFEREEDCSQCISSNSLKG